MDFNEYQEGVMRTWNKTISLDKQLLNVSLGLAGEAGEFADHVKKAMFHGHKIDTEHMSKELGDILYYVTVGCALVDKSLMDVAVENNIKLNDRYPNGFNSDDSINRKEYANESTK